MKQAKNFMIDENIIDLLRREENASAIVNELLKRHYEVEAVTHSASAEEAKIIKNVKIKMVEQDKEEAERQEFQKIENYLGDMDEGTGKMEEYLKGVQEGKWRSVSEFAKIKMYAI